MLTLFILAALTCTICPLLDGIYASLLSEEDNGSPDAVYDYDDDPNPAIKRMGPVAVAKLRPYGFNFNKEYGLPPVFAELGLLRRRSN